MTILEVDPGTLLFGLRLSIVRQWAGIFIGKYGFVIWGSGEDKRNEEPKECPDCGYYPGERSIFDSVKSEAWAQGKGEEEK